MLCINFNEVLNTFKHGTSKLHGLYTDIFVHNSRECYVYFQICNLQFASWTHDGSELALFSTDDSADDTDYVENGEWQLLEIPVIREQFYAPCCEAPFSYLNFHITLLRRSGYYVENLIFPSLLITTAGMLVFVLPPESGEKVSLSVTILLATTVYQLNVADHIPVQSKVFPIIGN
ncbi:hypothetical protein LSH36_605g03038 [Paralvinella palmiformis]|uniref:Neurotransmitter-gated ion-channel ligand-binding domain-containing protein n=1 Tax=Paralvinella palmiformis TaxID=53620 RepID=A0AAD9J5Y5_9ANNE|nr:hypothetical protein LSH36_605g03038 [Paralvinella palmiformis]